jgi:hypothetical protein
LKPTLQRSFDQGLDLARGNSDSLTPDNATETRVVPNRQQHLKPDYSSPYDEAVE